MDPRFRYAQKLASAITCPECRGLCAIVDTGLVCPEGCGPIRSFGAVLRAIAWRRSAGELAGLLRSAYPGQIVECRTAAQIAADWAKVK